MKTFTASTFAGPATRPSTLKFLALLAALLFTLGVVPLHAADGEAGETAVSTVNINTADARALATALQGVGLARAEDIIRYREEFGPFTTVEQLTEVKGIGMATLEKNRARIKLD